MKVEILTKKFGVLFIDQIKTDSEFEAVEEKALNFNEPVYIKWERPADGQIAYYSPGGVCFKPHWYNNKITPHKGGRTEKLTLQMTPAELGQLNKKAKEFGVPRIDVIVAGIKHLKKI